MLKIYIVVVVLVKPFLVMRSGNVDFSSPAKDRNTTLLLVKLNYAMPHNSLFIPEFGEFSIIQKSFNLNINANLTRAPVAGANAGLL